MNTTIHPPRCCERLESYIEDLGHLDKEQVRSKYQEKDFYEAFALATQLRQTLNRTGKPGTGDHTT